MSILAYHIGEEYSIQSIQAFRSMLTREQHSSHYPRSTKPWKSTEYVEMKEINNLETVSTI